MSATVSHRHPHVVSHVQVLDPAPKPVNGIIGVCEQCIAEGKADWVHLRINRTDGKVLCCDDSPSQHSRHHAVDSGNTVIRSFEPGEDWTYDFADESFTEKYPVDDDLLEWNIDQMYARGGQAKINKALGRQ